MMSNSSEEELDEPFDDEDNDKVKFEWGQFIKFRKTFNNTTGHRRSQGGVEGDAPPQVVSVFCGFYFPFQVF